MELIDFCSRVIIYWIIKWFYWHKNHFKHLTAFWKPNSSKWSDFLETLWSVLRFLWDLSVLAGGCWESVSNIWLSKWPSSSAVCSCCSKQEGPLRGGQLSQRVPERSPAETGDRTISVMFINMQSTLWQFISSVILGSEGMPFFFPPAIWK